MGLLILYAIIALVVSFLCSMVEAALLSFTPSFLKLKIQKGKNYAITLTKFKKDIDKPLIVILTLNTIAHTVGAIFVGVEAEKTFGDGNNILGLVTVVMTVAVLVLSEIIPKTIGATYWQSMGSFTATTLKILIGILKYSGILWCMMLTTKFIGKSAQVYSMSREEFIAITDAAREEGVFEKKETNIIKNLLLLNVIKARDIMTPFSVATVENEEMLIKEFHKKYRGLHFSRIPVYQDHRNDISGFIMKDEVLEAMLNKKGGEALKTLRRTILISSSDTPIPDLFQSFLNSRDHISVVVDEYGNTRGLVTMEDIIETLLGIEIMDELDHVEDMQVLARKKWEERAKRIVMIKNKP